MEVTSVMIVPNSADGILLNQLNKKEEQVNKLTGYSIKLVEGNGVPLYRSFPIPLGPKVCHNLEKCPVCMKSEGRSKCAIRGVVYTAECEKCWNVYSDPPDGTVQVNNDPPCSVDQINNKNLEGGITPIPSIIPHDDADRINGDAGGEKSKLLVPSNCDDRINNENEDGRRSIYVGETSRSLRERAIEHIRGGRNLDEKNFITKHWLHKHPDDLIPPEFTFSVDTIHKDPLSREINEAIKIRECESMFIILNSKSEWNSITLPRLCIEKKSWERKKEAIDTMNKEARDKAAVSSMKEKNKHVTFQSAIVRLGLSNKVAPCPQHMQINKLPYGWRGRNIVHNSDEIKITKKFSFSRSAKRKCAKFETEEEDQEKGLKLIPGTKRRRMLSTRLNHKSRAPVRQIFVDLVNDNGNGSSALSFDRCLSVGVRNFIDRMKSTGAGKSDTIPKDGLLWQLRDKIPNLDEYACDNDEIDNLLKWDEPDASASEYENQISSQSQNNLVREMLALNLERKKEESEREKDINSPLSEQVLKFVALLGSKLEENGMSDLFKEEKASPTTNLLVDMLKCHKLRTTYDFEKAVGRTFCMNELEWDFRLIDRVAGKGTAANTIFILKEKGNFGGAKRKLRFPRHETPPSKCSKVSEMCDLINSLKIGNRGSKPTDWNKSSKFNAWRKHSGPSKPINWNESSKPTYWNESSKPTNWNESSKPTRREECSKPNAQNKRSKPSRVSRKKQGRETPSPVKALKVSQTRCGWSGSKKISPRKVSPTTEARGCGSQQNNILLKTPITKKIKPRGERTSTLRKKTPVSIKAQSSGSILKFLHRTPGTDEAGQSLNKDKCGSDC